MHILVETLEKNLVIFCYRRSHMGTYCDMFITTASTNFLGLYYTYK